MFESLKYNLKHNRKSVAKKATAWFFFGAIIIVMGLWGMTPDGQMFGQGGVAATVNNSSITLAQLSETVERMRQDPRFAQLQSLGGNAGQEILQQQAMSQLIDTELIRQTNQENSVFVSDAEVRDFIVSIPQFQENGRFKRELYMGYLNAVRKTPAQFEEDVRRDQALRRTVRVFNSALRPLDLEEQKRKTLAEMKANVEFLMVPTENLVKPSAVKAEDLKAYLANAENEPKIKSYFDTNKSQFSTPEQVKARHILVRAEAGNAEAEKVAQQKIEGLAKRADTEDFAKLATAHSEDPGSKSNGGLLDFFSRGRMVPEFEEAAFSTEPGQISKPVKTQYGYHLIKVLEKRPASERTLDEAREEIARNLLAQEQSKAAVASLQEELKNSNQAAIAKFASDHGLKWEETGAFSIDTENVPKIGANDEVVTVAFGLSPEKPLASSLVRQGPSAYVIRHKPVAATRAAAKANETSEQSDFLSEMLASRRGEDALSKWVEGLRKEAEITTNTQALGTSARR